MRTPSPVLARADFDVLEAGFDYAYGAKFMSDYIVRGISNSAHRPAGSVYEELRYGWFYTGLAATNVTLATSLAGRDRHHRRHPPTWGPLTLDFGAIYYAYPSNHQQWFIGGAIPVTTFKNSYTALPTTAFDPSYVEIYFKPSWAVNDYLTLGGQIAYAPNWNNYSAHALYSEINAKVVPSPTPIIRGCRSRAPSATITSAIRARPMAAAISIRTMPSWRPAFSAPRASNSPATTHGTSARPIIGTW